MAWRIAGHERRGRQHEHGDKIEIGADLRRDAGKIQPARPALHELSNRAGVEGRFRPGRPRRILRPRRRSSPRRCRSTCIFPSARACAFSARATSRSRRTRAVAIPYLAALKREIDHVGADGLAEAAGDSVPLGRRHADVSCRPRRWRISSATRASAFRSRPDAEIGIEIDPRVTSRAHLETLRRLGFNRLSMGIQDFEPKVQETIHRVQPYEMTRDLIVSRARAGLRKPQRGLDLRPALPDRRNFPGDDRPGADARARPRGDVQLRARAVAQEAAGRICDASARRARRNSRSSAPGSKDFSTPAISTSAWTISRGRATNLRSRSGTARCTAIFRATRRRPAPTFTAWA